MEVQGTLYISKCFSLGCGQVPLQVMAFRLLGDMALPEPFLSNCQMDAKILALPVKLWNKTSFGH